MSNKVVKTAQIKVQVGLNEGNMPIRIDWISDDNPNNKNKKPQACKAMLLSMFDKEQRETLKIDLWTTEMQVNEMDRFFFQTLRALADTYYKATQNAKLASEMQHFVQYFGEQTEIIPKNK